MCCGVVPTEHAAVWHRVSCCTVGASCVAHTRAHTSVAACAVHMHVTACARLPAHESHNMQPDAASAYSLPGAMAAYCAPVAGQWNASPPDASLLATIVCCLPARPRVREATCCPVVPSDTTRRVSITCTVGRQARVMACSDACGRYR